MTVVALALCAAHAEPFDFTVFEDNLLGQWLSLFRVPAQGPGAFAYVPGGSNSGVYGTADVVHVLAVTQQLNLTDAEKQQWGQHIDSFQNASTGFYALQSVEAGAGYQPWHAAGFATSALRILGQQPAYPPLFAQAIALGNESVWTEAIASLFTANETIWAMSHKAAAVPDVLIMTDPEYNTKYGPFFTWLWEFFNATNAQSPGEYYFCLPPNIPPPTSCDCLGGAFHVGFTLHCGQQPLPGAAQMLDITLKMQNPQTGLWNGDKTPSYMDLDGVWVTTRTSVQLGNARWPEVQTMCQRFLGAAHAVLTNASVLLSPQTEYAGIVHTLAGVVTGVAECAKWFPDLLVTRRPWVNTVDTACFV